MNDTGRSDDFLTAMEAAKRLGVSDTAVRKRIASGSLSATKNGRGWRIPRSEIERLLNSDVSEPNRTEPTEPERTNPNPSGSLGSDALQPEIDRLRCDLDMTLDRALSAEKCLQTALDSIQGLTEQIDHAQQLVAISQKSIQQLTEQNQLLLEDQRHRKLPLLKRIFRWT